MGRGFRCHMRGVGPWRPVCGADRSAARCAGNRSGEVRVAGGRVCAVVRPRSEEHTSELQSLMRISYAVFCLKKKIKNKTRHKKKGNHSIQRQKCNQNAKTIIGAN